MGGKPGLQPLLNRRMGRKFFGRQVITGNGLYSRRY